MYHDIPLTLDLRRVILYFIPSFVSVSRTITMCIRKMASLEIELNRYKIMFKRSNWSRKPSVKSPPSWKVPNLGNLQQVFPSPFFINAYPTVISFSKTFPRTRRLEVISRSSVDARGTVPNSYLRISQSHFSFGAL